LLCFGRLHPRPIKSFLARLLACLLAPPPTSTRIDVNQLLLLHMVHFSNSINSGVSISMEINDLPFLRY